MSFPLSAPFTMTISGPTVSDKSVWMEKFIDSIDALVDKKFESIIWCYSEFQSISSKIRVNPKVKFHQGVPDLSEISNGSKAHRLICLDELMMEIDSSIVNLFTKGAHHWNLSVIFITQNLFHQGKGHRDISLNSHYIIKARYFILQDKSIPKIRYSFKMLIEMRLQNRTVTAICECVLNVLKGNVQLKSCHKSRISRYKKILRKIIKRGGCWKKKRRIIVQKGSGFLPVIISAALSSLIGSFIK
ncbi:hypothetical protein J437_LFUL019375 [Ladona fulva]|uniref:Uncharacterized protein n=1 Tax=Ladona fulva TaxID=123851 RepID=A0A8K0KXB2_LADFU|nr:hypothetical protein J437_LFUL019375 [Ladona fulva]